MAAIEYRGLNAVTNFDLSRYVKWLKPHHHASSYVNPNHDLVNPNNILQDTSSISSTLDGSSSNHHHDFNLSFFNNNQQSAGATSANTETPTSQPVRPVTATSALGLLLQSSKFKEMMEMTTTTITTASSEADHCYQSTPPLMEPDPLQCRFPEDIQTYFGCQDSSSYGEGEDEGLFGELNSLVPPIFQSDFDA